MRNLVSAEIIERIKQLYLAESTCRRDNIGWRRNLQMNESDEHISQLLIQVHLAEYQALMARSTNYIAMGAATWPLGVSLLGFLTAFFALLWQHLTEAQIHKYRFFIVGWLSVFAIQLALIFWTFLVREQYKTALYLETKLRPLVQDLVQTQNFWLYERKIPELTMPDKTILPKLFRLLHKWLELQTELWVFILFVATILYRIYTAHGFGFWDWLGVAGNAVAFVLLVYWAVAVAEIRQQWEA